MVVILYVSLIFFLFARNYVRPEPPFGRDFFCVCLSLVEINYFHWKREKCLRDKSYFAQTKFKKNNFVYVVIM